MEQTSIVFAESWLPNAGIALDANGNTTSSGGISNTYDFENRMLTHGSLSLVYDGDGNRVSETVGGTATKFLVDDHNPTGLPQVLDEIVGGSITRTYAYGLQRISENQQIGGNWTPSFYGYDGHANVRFLTNSSGAITDSYDYDAFGMPIRTSGTTPNVLLYSAERYDSNIGLYDLRARYFDQATGRFWARDPVEGVKCCGLSWNPYIYVKDNAVNAVDPTGRDLIEFVATGPRFATYIPGILKYTCALISAYSAVADVVDFFSSRLGGPENPDPKFPSLIKAGCYFYTFGTQVFSGPPEEPWFPWPPAGTRPN